MGETAHVECREVVELVTAYLERALPAETTALVEAHLRTCDGCTAYVEQMRRTIAIEGRVDPDALPAEAEERLRTAFRGWARERRA
jgi:anti-sigma factor RsiW